MITLRDVIYAIQREDAQRVLEKLSTLLHKEFTLETVYVALVKKP
jgi:hypothetical protein